MAMNYVYQFNERLRYTVCVYLCNINQYTSEQKQWTIPDLHHLLE